MADAASPDTPTDPLDVARQGLDHVYDFLYDQNLLVETVTGDAHQPTMSTAIRIANALADAGLLSLSGDTTQDRSAAIDMVRAKLGRVDERDEEVVDALRGLETL